MRHYTDAERALIDSFQKAGGERAIRLHRGEPCLPRDEAEALARLLRCGRIRRHASLDFGWVTYRLHAWAGGEVSPESPDAETSFGDGGEGG